MKKNIFIGGAWPYANNSLHVGHLAALLPGDILARYYRAKGDNVVYVSGTDSHGTPITVRAKKEGKNPQEIALKYHNEFVKNFNDLDFSYDEYTSTMSAYHKEHVQKYLKIIDKNGYIYKKTEEQDYCPHCQTFLSDREIIGICPHCGKEAKGDQCDNCLSTLNAKDVLFKKCSICGSATIQKENTHLYFKLSAFQDKVANLIEKNSHIWRLNAVKESEKFLSQGLKDRALTRQLDWGVEVPFEGFEDKRVYVWFEAVMGYITTACHVLEQRGQDFEEFMESANTISYYVHGKDNIPFHTIIYPSLLMAINKKWNLPNFIISCEYVNMNNEKMSKSKGNLISIDELVSLYPKDSIRFFMIANGPETKDCNFSNDDFKLVHNKFLVGVIGNFINRNLSFLNKKFGGKIAEGKIDENIIAMTRETFEKVGKQIEEGRLKSAINLAIDYVNAGNKYYSDRMPWVQVQEDIEGFNDTTYTCVYMMANIARLFAPFIPDTCARINRKLGLEEKAVWQEVKIKGDLLVQNNELLFQRLQ